jgi:predicted nucleotidyltransferase
MNLNEIKQLINSDVYSFLRQNEHLGKNIILLTTGGSHAYGTEVETSDLDIRGVAVERIQERLGLATFEQFENKETDTVVYALRKYVDLILNCNPNVIEMLGTKEEHLFICAPEILVLRDNINLFLSRKAIGSFGGYATQQLRRLQNALARDTYPEAEKEIHILNSIKNSLITLSERYQELTNGSLSLYIEKSEKPDIETEIFMDISLQHYPLRDFKNIYSDMNNIVHEYGKLTHRNNKKDELHLNKHAMHLIRLLIMGTEILEGKGVNTYRENDRDFLLSVRNGKWSYEQIFEMVDEYEKKFQYAANNTTLPKNPDYHAVEEILINMYRKYYV